MDFLNNKTNEVVLKDSDTNVVFGMLVKVIFSLIIIIGIFLLIIKVLAQKNKKWMAGRVLKPMGGVTVGQNKSIQVVQIGHAVYVIGVGDNVQLIEKIKDADEAAYIIDCYSSGYGKDHKDPFFPKHWVKRFNKGQPEVVEEDLSSSFQQVFQEKMSGLSNRKKMVEEMLNEKK